MTALSLNLLLAFSVVLTGIGVWKLVQSIRLISHLRSNTMKRKLLALAALAALSTGANAALSTEVTGAITGAGTDAAAAVGLMIVVAVSIWALRKVARLFGN
ncbi:MAG: hypothetical protein B7Y41_08080 [Hydrogenophilales bacterium 28-61-23]|nr:MAG: hypothetical protein B7Y41_08080 [Hydrogenophilales bacterium 28-61-23]